MRAAAIGEPEQGRRRVGGSRRLAESLLRRRSEPSRWTETSAARASQAGLRPRRRYGSGRRPQDERRRGGGSGGSIVARCSLAPLEPVVVVDDSDDQMTGSRGGADGEECETHPWARAYRETSGMDPTPPKPVSVRVPALCPSRGSATCSGRRARPDSASAIPWIAAATRRRDGAGRRGASESVEGRRVRTRRREHPSPAAKQSTRELADREVGGDPVPAVLDVRSAPTTIAPDGDAVGSFMSTFWVVP